MICPCFSEAVGRELGLASCSMVERFSSSRRSRSVCSLILVGSKEIKTLPVTGVACTCSTPSIWRMCLSRGSLPCPDHLSRWTRRRPGRACRICGRSVVITLIVITLSEKRQTDYERRLVWRRTYDSLERIRLYFWVRFICFKLVW